MVFEALALGIARLVISAIRPVSDWIARRRGGPAERLRHSLAIKAEVSTHFPAILPPHTNGEAIIRELRRMDSYPDLDDSLRGISPWFKVELKGTYYAGVEVFTSVQSVTIRNGVARPADPEDADAENVFVVGRVPYSVIEAIDWDGDECYGFTHIYCRFRGWGGRKGPYESVELYATEAHDLGGGRRYYEHLEGVRWKPKRRGLIRRWQDRRMLRQMDRNTGG